MGSQWSPPCTAHLLWCHRHARRSSVCGHEAHTSRPPDPIVADGPLFAAVKPDDCLWNLVDGRQLEVTLQKVDPMQVHGVAQHGSTSTAWGTALGAQHGAQHGAQYGAHYLAAGHLQQMAAPLPTCCPAGVDVARSNECGAPAALQPSHG